MAFLCRFLEPRVDKDGRKKKNWGRHGWTKSTISVPYRNSSLTANPHVMPLPLEYVESGKVAELLGDLTQPATGKTCDAIRHIMDHSQSHNQQFYLPLTTWFTLES